MADEPAWYYADRGQSVGPLTLVELARKLPSLAGDKTMVYGPATNEWVEARHVAELRDVSRPQAPPRPPSAPMCDVIDYEVFGEEMQHVEITLDSGETVIAEAGSMMYMTPSIDMQTVFGDPAQQSGGIWGKVVAAGKRVLTGESLFVTTYRNAGADRAVVAFAAPYPGKIIPMHLSEHGGELICQKDSFLCAAKGVQVGIAFQKKIGVALFGGEGFIMQRLSGDGIAMIHAGGNLVRKTLAPGETLRLDTGCLVALTPQVKYDIQFTGNVKNALFGGEGLFLCTLTGPGNVWLQTLPLSRLAGRIVSAARVGGSKEEGSVLGGLGRLLDGDNG